jgi:hypothetical protein
LPHISQEWSLTNQFGRPFEQGSRMHRGARSASRWTASLWTDTGKKVIACTISQTPRTSRRNHLYCKRFRWNPLNKSNKPHAAPCRGKQIQPLIKTRYTRTGRCSLQT